MRVVLLGPPGAGKGTQAQKLAEQLDIPHISTGELFRRNIGAGTALGLRAKRHLDAGELVPASLTNALVADRLSRPDAAGGFILDGFPRSYEQAEALNMMVDIRNTHIDGFWNSGSTRQNS
jgi:adenylate kinase